MNKEKADIKARFNNPVCQFRKLQMQCRQASRRIDSEESQEAFLELRSSKERDALVKRLPPPYPPSVLFYPPPGADRRDNSDNEEQAEGPVLEKGDLISPPPRSRRKVRLQLGEAICNLRK